MSKSGSIKATYQPSKRSIGELLTITNPPIIVPDWQRSYSWTPSHVETFWNDLTYFMSRDGAGAKSEYFLGSVVVVETSSGEFLLLDGQQRLATAAILISAIRDFLSKKDAEASVRTQSRYLADYDDARREQIYKLTLNAYDRDFFRHLILEPRKKAYKQPKPVYPSHNLLLQARKYFDDVIEKQTKESKKNALKWIFDLQKTLTERLTLIAITSSDEDTAAEVFETLNDRGIGLSTPDLLRNLVIRRTPASKRDDIVSLWGDIIGFETDAEIRSFLRHYWISNYGDVKTQGLYREIKNHIESKNVGSFNLSRSLKDAALIYRDLRASRDDDPAVEGVLKEINTLGAGASILYPVLLSIVQCVTPEHRHVLISALLTLYVRHSIIMQLENSKLENFIYKVATALRKKVDVEATIKSFASFSADDKALSSAFSKLSISHNGTRRYLLSKLETFQRTGETEIASSSKVHVEHIYPQTPDAALRLPNHVQIVDRLGNLTLLSKRIDVSIKNGPFKKKKTEYRKSEIKMTKDLAKLNVWGVEQIEARQLRFADLARKVWSFGGLLARPKAIKPSAKNPKVKSRGSAKRRKGKRR